MKAKPVFCFLIVKSQACFDIDSGRHFITASDVMMHENWIFLLQFIISTHLT